MTDRCDNCLYWAADADDAGAGAQGTCTWHSAWHRHRVATLHASTCPDHRAEPPSLALIITTPAPAEEIHQ